MLQVGSPTFISTRSIGSTSPLPQTRTEFDPLQRLKEMAQVKSLARSRSQSNIIQEAMKDNRIFTELPFSSRLLEEIAAEVEVISTLEACRLPYIEGQLLLFVSGSAYEYVQNFYQQPHASRTGRRRSANPEALQQFALIRKIKPNEYFSSYLPKSRYEGDQRKMQLVAEANTVVVRVHQDLFHRYFEKKLEFHMQESFNLLRQFDMMRDLRKNLIFELTKYLERVTFASKAILYSKGDRSDYFYFLRKGSVLLKEEKQANLERGPLNKKFVVRNSTSSLLLEPGSVIGVDGILINTSSDVRMYTAETITEVQVWRIDKRPLIVLISSYGQSDPQPKKMNEVNLSNQIGEVQFNSKEYELLQQNVKRIKTSEKKIRDIKLRSMGSSSGIRRRANSQTAIRHATRQNEQLYNELRETVRTAAIYKMSEFGVEEIRNMQATPAHIQMSLPVTSKTIPVGAATGSSWFSHAQQTVNTILLTPEDPDGPAPTDFSNKQTYMPRSISSKLIRNCNRYGKEQKQILLSHIEKKRNIELKNKLLNVHENKAEQKQSEMVRVKRIFHSRTKKSEPVLIQPKQIEDALLSKMCNMNDSPLLFHMESLRKKLLSGSTSPFVSKVKQKLVASGALPPAHNVSQKQNYSSKILIRDL